MFKCSLGCKTGSITINIYAGYFAKCYVVSKDIWSIHHEILKRSAKPGG